MSNYKVKNLFKDISHTIYNCCIDQSTFLISKLSHWYLSWRSSPQLIKYLQILTRNMPSVSLDTQFYTISLEQFEKSVNRRRIDNTMVKEQTMIYRTLHRKLKIEQHEPWTQMLQKSKQFALLPVRYWDFLVKYINNIHTLSTKIKFISTSFRNRKKASLRQAFLSVSQRFQINVIFTDNVRILCLSCKTKMSKTTANFPENIRSKRHSNRLPWCHLSRSHLYWYSFFSLLNMNQIPEKLYFGEWSYATQIFQSVQYDSSNRSSAG